MIYLYLLSFIVCAIIILFTGKQLAYYGDLLAEKSGIGKAWFGLILMSAVTSLPELVVGVSSSYFVQSADLATGDIFGSCSFNLCIIALLDIFVPNKKSIFHDLSKSHYIAGAFVIILMTIAGIGLLKEQPFIFLPSLGNTSILLLVGYLISIRVIYLYQKQNSGKTQEESHSENNLSTKAIIVRYAGFALIIIAVAVFLPSIADHIAELSGLGKSFVGTLFLAISTSLPEIAVSIAAIKMGSTDMAIGNLLGSNVFNMFILFLNDVFYTKGTILHDASKGNLYTVFCVIVMTAIVYIGMTIKTQTKKFIIGYEAFFLILIYILNLFLLY